jgi:hypothetical protein
VLPSESREPAEVDTEASPVMDSASTFRQHREQQPRADRHDRVVDRLHQREERRDLLRVEVQLSAASVPPGRSTRWSSGQ